MGMMCARHRVPVAMHRVVNQAGTMIGNQAVGGTPKARCTKCCLIVDCAICPQCGSTVCVPCYNKSIDERGKPPKIGPSLGETSSI